MTREDILEAAAQIFSQKGYHAASMQDIANSVNLQKASLYHHVSSKQEILLELLDQALDLLIGQIEPICQSSLSHEDKLRQAMRQYVHYLTENRDLAAILLLEHRSLEEDLRQRHLPRRDRFEHLWRVLIQAGSAAGDFCACDSAMAARALLGQMNWVITWYRADGVLSAMQVADQFADLFLSGLLQRSPA
ncbi:MAG: TetR family transcriptional regulator [Anaerolineales bacterium]|nr:TetR family transcriptional regulator [Anaerolineales bacterium]